ncbi:uncharacterized protein METZ01_LOCUS476479 [marine metagenome]|uniref:Uncharacterized protein n=1 Tax=marine metagenome TaxID=408172 RepID=A0A383BWI2_9ZZZZ
MHPINISRIAIDNPNGYEMENNHYSSCSSFTFVF